MVDEPFRSRAEAMARTTHLAAVLQHLRRTIGTPGAGLADAELLERFVARRDEAAFELLVRRHEQLVFGVCRRVLGREQDAEDAFQATFLTLACKAAAIGRRAALAGWLYQVAFRIALRARARAQARAQRENAQADPALVAGSADPAALAARRDCDQVVDEEVSRLPAKFRLPLLLCYFEGKSNEEAARQLGCPVGTVVTHLARARDRLRTRLLRRGVQLSAALTAAAASERTFAAVVDTTVRAALYFEAGSPGVNSLLSCETLALTKGALKAMFMNQVKAVAAFLLVLGVIGASARILTYAARACELSAPAMAPDEGDPAPAAAIDDPVAPKADKDRPPDKHRTAREVVQRSFATGATPRVIVELYNGGVTVQAKGQGAVSVQVTKQGHGLTEEAAKEALKNVQVEMTHKDDVVHITARPAVEEQRHHSSGASAEVQVPAGAVLELHTGNGPVTVTGGTGAVKVKTSNGKVQVQDSKGSQHLDTANGPIIVVGGTGRLELKTTNGAIDIRAEKAVITAKTSNGSIRFQGTLADGAQAFHTSNGSIEISLPADARFRFDAETSHGRITNEFGKNQAVRGQRLRMDGTVGANPATSLKLHTSNGSIALRPTKAAG
jgi:RNA polymerase sigma factor (sigma-70 family)